VTTAEGLPKGKDGGVNPVLGESRGGELVERNEDKEKEILGWT
jgi:hypothetical protein